jgi:hypothetical protein
MLHRSGRPRVVLVVGPSIRSSARSESSATSRGDDAFSASTNVGRSQAHGKGLIAWSAAKWRDKHWRVMVGGAEYDRFIRTNRVHIEDVAGSREKEEGPRRRSTAPQETNQRLLRRCVQTVLKHVDNLCSRAFCLQCRQQCDESFGGVATNAGRDCQRWWQSRPARGERAVPIADLRSVVL